MWNELTAHKRKYLTTMGSYITSKDGKSEYGKMTFWGEWEAHSYFKSTGLPVSQSPQYLHEPYLDKSYKGPRRHNTDPFIFGNCFWYTNCKQKPNGFMTKLDMNSLILFGTERKDGFYLDTVFVVGDRLKPPFSMDFMKTIPEQLKETNFTHNNLVNNPDKSFLTFYKSLTRNDSRDYFSFVPCKPFKDDSVHERPILKPWDKFSLQKPGARSVCTRLLKEKLVDGGLSDGEIKKYWRAIADTCLEQGFSLGVSFDLPELKAT